MRLQQWISETLPKGQRGEMLRSAGMLSAMRIAGGLFAFVASLLYARALGAHGYGLYAYVMAWVGVLAIAVGMGFPQVMVREGARFPSALRQLYRLSDRRLIASGSTAAILMACAYFVPAAAEARWLFVLAAPLPMLAAIGSTRSALLQSQGRAARSQWPRLVLNPMLIIVGLTLVWQVQGYLRPIDLMAATLLAAALTLAINHVQLLNALPAATPDMPLPAGAPTVRAALPFMWVSALYLLNSRMDLIVLGALKGAHEAGIYAVAARLAETTSFVMATANMVMAPKMAQLHHAEDIALLQRMTRAAMRRVLVLSLPIGVFLLAAASPLLRSLYGLEFESSATPLRILVVAQILVVASGPLGILLNMTGHERVLARNVVAAVGLNVLLNLALVPAFASTGAAIATAVALAFSRLLLWRQVRNRLQLGL